MRMANAFSVAFNSDVASVFRFCERNAQTQGGRCPASYPEAIAHGVCEEVLTYKFTVIGTAWTSALDSATSQTI